MKRTKVRVAMVALVSTVVGVIILWVSTGVDGSPNVVISTVGTVIISIGISNSLLDHLLRKSVATDLMSYVETDRRIIESGLDGIDTFQGIDWGIIFGDGSVIRCYMNNPIQFKEIVWPKLLESSKENTKQIDLAFVNPNGSGVQTLAQHLGDDPTHYSESLQRVMLAVEREWKATRNLRHKRTDLVIRTIDEPAHYSYVVGKDRIVLVLDPIKQSTGHATTRALMLRTDRKERKSAKWLVEEIEALEKQFNSPTYSDRVENANGAGELD